MSTLTFLMSHMVYFNNMKRNLGHIKVTQKPPQPMDYDAVRPSVKPCDYMSINYVLFERQLHPDYTFAD